MIHTPCTFCVTFEARPDGKPFTCSRCEKRLAQGEIRTLTLPSSFYINWRKWWEEERCKRTLFRPSDRILRASG
jgi:hypothetical protein